MLADGERDCVAAFAVICLGCAGAAFVSDRFCCLATVRAEVDLGLGFGVVDPAPGLEF
jgi:hypothetical protein